MRRALGQAEFNALRRLFWVALPLGIGTMLGSLNTNIPRYVIERYLGARDLGIFSALAYFMVAGSLVANALSQAATPRLAYYHAGGQGERFRLLVWRQVMLGAGLGLSGIIGAFLLGAPVLRLLYGPEYAARSSVLLVLAAASALTYAYVPLGTAVNAMRMFRIQLPITATMVVALAVSSVFLIPRYGMRGAAFAMLASAAIEALLYATVLMRSLREHKLTSAS
jgi:O-antigen/teichoic acid export membrane protein